MYIADIIPLIFIPRNHPQLLSYYSKEPLSRGDLVRIPFRKKDITGIVLRTDPLSARKSELRKTHSFQLRPVRERLAQRAVPETLIETAQWVSEHYVAPLGITLKHMLPPFFSVKKYQKELLAPDTPGTRATQRLILVPEITDIEFIKKRHMRGTACVIHGQLSNKEQYDAWRSVASGGTRTIIGTRSALFYPYVQLTNITIEDYSNEGYYADSTPYYYSVTAARHIAAQHGASVEYATPHRTIDTKKMKIRISSHQPDVRIEDMTKGMNVKRGALSAHLTDRLFNDTTRRALIFIGRRGYANYIVCRQCGKIIRCPQCDVSLVYHKETANLLCHHCGHVEDKPHLCPHCGSYGLRGGGIGIEKTVEHLERERRFRERSFADQDREQKKLTILRLDSDTAKNEKQASEIIEEYNRRTEDSELKFLVATQMIFKYKHSVHSDITGIIDADTLIQIPDFRSQERLYRQLCLARSMTQNELIVQTRNPHNPAIDAVATRAEDAFIRDELDFRKTFAYPPFASLIKLGYRHRIKKHAYTAAVNAARHLAEKLRNIPDTAYEITPPYSAWIPKEKNMFTWYIIIKIKDESASESVIRTLHSLPPEWRIQVEPRIIV